MGVGDPASSLVGRAILRGVRLPLSCEIGVNGPEGAWAPHPLSHMRQFRQHFRTSGQVGIRHLRHRLQGIHVLGTGQNGAGSNHPWKRLRPSKCFGAEQLEDVLKAVEKCQHDAGPRYIIGAGCEVPREIPVANMIALRDYAVTHSALVFRLR